MKLWSSFSSYACLIFISACSTKELSMSQDFKNNNRSSKIEKRELKGESIRFLDYKAYKNSDLGTSYGDSILRSGILLNSKSINEENTEKEMQFGNDSFKCIIHFYYDKKIYHEGRSAALSLINLFSKKSNKIRQKEPVDHIIGVQASGTIQYPEFKNELLFWFDENKDNPETTSGYLLINADSLFLKPIMEGVKKDGRQVKKFLGLQLVKGAKVYAALENRPNMIFLYSKATSSEQLVIAAYCAIVAEYR